MAETSIPVQPAASGAPVAQPLQLKMITALDGLGGQAGPLGMVAIQAMCLVDDQGRIYQPMTEATGQQIVRLLGQLIKTTVEQGQGGFYPQEENAFAQG